MKLKLTCTCGAIFEYEDKDHSVIGEINQRLSAKIDQWRTDHFCCVDKDKRVWKVPHDFYGPAYPYPGKVYPAFTYEEQLQRIEKSEWIFKVHYVNPGAMFPPDQECLICGHNHKQDFFAIKGDGEKEEGDHVFVHVECFVKGEFKYQHRNKLIYYMPLGG